MHYRAIFNGAHIFVNLGNFEVYSKPAKTTFDSEYDEYPWFYEQDKDLIIACKTWAKTYSESMSLQEFLDTVLK